MQEFDFEYFELRTMQEFDFNKMFGRNNKFALTQQQQKQPIVITGL